MQLNFQNSFASKIFGDVKIMKQKKILIISLINAIIMLTMNAWMNEDGNDDDDDDDNH